MGFTVFDFPVVALVLTVDGFASPFTTTTSRISRTRLPVADWTSMAARLNQIERFFALITQRIIRLGTSHSVNELEKAI